MQNDHLSQFGMWSTRSRPLQLLTGIPPECSEPAEVLHQFTVECDVFLIIISGYVIQLLLIPDSSSRRAHVDSDVVLPLMA